MQAIVYTYGICCLARKLPRDGQNAAAYKCTIFNREPCTGWATNQHAEESTASQGGPSLSLRCFKCRHSVLATLDANVNLTPELDLNKSHVQHLTSCCTLWACMNNNPFYQVLMEGRNRQNLVGRSQQPGRSQTYEEARRQMQCVDDGSWSQRMRHCRCKSSLALEASTGPHLHLSARLIMTSANTP